jgi:hypothetical protein
MLGAALPDTGACWTVVAPRGAPDPGGRRDSTAADGAWGFGSMAGAGGAALTIRSAPGALIADLGGTA